VAVDNDAFVIVSVTRSVTVVGRGVGVSVTVV
jgi:hypothetical protein